MPLEDLMPELGPCFANAERVKADCDCRPNVVYWNGERVFLFCGIGEKGDYCANREALLHYAREARKFYVVLGRDRSRIDRIFDGAELWANLRDVRPIGGKKGRGDYFWLNLDAMTVWPSNRDPVPDDEFRP